MYDRDGETETNAEVFHREFSRHLAKTFTQASLVQIGTTVRVDERMTFRVN